jgi:hypothetical protein
MSTPESPRKRNRLKIRFLSKHRKISEIFAYLSIFHFSDQNFVARTMEATVGTYAANRGTVRQSPNHSRKRSRLKIRLQ